VAVKIRLMRVGKKKQPTYRVVVADSRSPRDGRYIEILGQYEPRQEPSVFTIDNDKTLGWLRKGARPTEQVHKLLIGNGVWAEYESGLKGESKVTRTARAKAKGAQAAQSARAEAAKAEAAAKAAEEAAAKAAAAEAEAEAPAEEPAAEAPAEEAPAEESE
jgi:small subunit ribosomal protein S16